MNYTVLIKKQTYGDQDQWRVYINPSTGGHYVVESAERARSICRDLDNNPNYVLSYNEYACPKYRIAKRTSKLHLAAWRRTFGEYEPVL